MKSKNCVLKPLFYYIWYYIVSGMAVKCCKLQSLSARIRSCWMSSQRWQPRDILDILIYTVIMQGLLYRLALHDGTPCLLDSIANLHLCMSLYYPSMCLHIPWQHIATIYGTTIRGYIDKSVI